MNVTNKRWPDDYFFAERKNVLDMWPTGKEVDLDEAVAYHKKMPKTRNAALKDWEAKEKGVAYLWPSLGTDSLAAHKELLLYMQEQGEVDFLTSYIDSLTRNCRFKEAEEELNKGKKTGKATLNGFPIVIHGVRGCREVIEAVDLPVIFLGPTPDARLTHEIALAGGHTGYSGGPLISFWNYTKDIPIEQIIHNYQYTHRLMGYYEEKEAALVYCVSGAMPSISPPSLMIAPEIIEVLIAAEQGVKHIRLNSWTQGNIIQDIAYIRTFEKLTREYLDTFGYADVKTTTYSANPTGRFPTGPDQVFALIAYFTLVGVLAKVQGLGSRTIDEAHHIPTKEGSARSFRCARMLINMLGPQKLDILDHQAINTESDFIKREVKAILDKVLEMGDGDVIIGTKRAIDVGILDQPYATSQLVQGRVMGVKDHEGAARFFDFGNLPFDHDIKEFHRQKISRRQEQIGKQVDYDTVIKDLTAISEGGILPLS